MSSQKSIIHLIRESEDELQMIANTVLGSRKCIVISGAGISTNAGIPISYHFDLSLHETHKHQDFRSSDGLYGISQQSKPSIKDVFHATALSHPEDGSLLVKLCTKLRKTLAMSKPTETHRFIKSLSVNGKLVRNYSQNIDLLEDKVGLCADLVRGAGGQSKTGYNGEERRVQRTKGSNSPRTRRAECVRLHGSLRYLRCVTCGQRSSWDEWEDVTMSGTLPTCFRCPTTSSRGRTLIPGVLRPDIVLYGETDPQSDLISDIIYHDLCLNLDLLLILGTSLATYGVRKLVKDFRRTVKGCNGLVIYVNRTNPADGAFTGVIDYWVEWDCDDWVRDLMRRSEFLAGVDNTDRSPNATLSHKKGIAANKRHTSVPESASKRIKVSQIQASFSNKFHSMSSTWCAAGTQDNPIDLTNEIDMKE